MNIDKNTVLQIFGSLMKQPSLLAEVDRYILSPSDFSNSFEQYIFGAIYNLYANGAEKVTVVDIDNYLSNRDFAYSTFNSNNGIEYLQDAEDLASVENFDYYYRKLKKLNAIKELKRAGYPTSKLYPENLLDVDYEKKLEAFENMSIGDIFDFIKREIAKTEDKYTAGASKENIKANEGIESLIAELKISPEVGFNLQGEIFNAIVRGARRGKYYIRSAGTGVGKAIPNDTLIPTPVGFRKVGEIQVGDYLFRQDGKPTKVVAVYPQGEKEIWEVEFGNGKIAECCKDHLWEYRYESHGEYSYRVESIEEIYERSKKYKTGLKGSANKGYRFHIRNNEPVQYSKKTLPVHPYIMGALLGDGSLRYSKTNKALTFSSKTAELPNQIASLLGENWYAKKSSDNNYNYTFKNLHNPEHNLWVEELLKDFPLLWQTKSEEKFIPEEYLQSDVEDRFELLRGLLDTDGSIDEKGRVSYFTISPKLRDNMRELCHSLGMTTSFMEDVRPNQYTTGVGYEIRIQAKKEYKPLMFSLSYKKQRAENYALNGKRREEKTHTPIVRITPTNKKTEMTCFTVDNESALFLMNDFIVTHNTRNMVADASYLAYPIRYDSKKCKWVRCGSCEKILYIATEQKPEEIQTMILAYLTEMNEEKILFGRYTDEEEIILKQAIEVMNHFADNFIIAQLPNPSMEQIKSTIRKYNLVDEVDYVFYDYIFSSPALLAEFKGTNVREDVVLLMLSTMLKDLAVELDVFMMTATQLNAEADKQNGVKNQNAIRASKSIIDKADMAAIVSRISQEELRTLDVLIKKTGMYPNIVTDIYKLRRGRYTNVRIWSHMDLGTLRKTDLFLTDGSYNEVEDFVPSRTIFELDELKQTEEILSFLNDGVITKEKEEELTQRGKDKVIELSDLTTQDNSLFGGLI